MSDAKQSQASVQTALDSVSGTQQNTPSTPLRFVTAASLFDGHDASINIMRRILQSLGVEVIHLAHNRSVAEVVQAALQEDVQGIALSSYQGGHVEYFKYIIDMLKENGADHIKVFGGGGGVRCLSARKAELWVGSFESGSKPWLLFECTTIP